MDPIQRGNSGAAVAEVEMALTALGLLNRATTWTHVNQAYFDDICETAVRTFQQQRGLKVDGIVGSETYLALLESRWRLGDRLLREEPMNPLTGDDVRALQEQLLEMGYNAGRPDGVFGSRTAGALRGFQRDYGLRADGSCGPRTLRALQQLSRRVVGGRPQLLRETAALLDAGPHIMGKRIVIDPGHGGDDPGAVWDDLLEADLVWDVASRLEGQLMAFGAYVHLTRGPYTARTVADRSEFANTTDADLLISLHIDAHASSRANGVATYHFGSGPGVTSSVGEALAQLVQQEIVSRTGLVDCRTHCKTWNLLRLTRMPAVYIELGYLTNADDRARLADPNFREVAAQAIFAAIQQFYFAPEPLPGLGTAVMTATQ